MNGFRGNHRSAGPVKKERKVKTCHHEEACKCSAPFVKLHYNDCPVLTKTCPLHGKDVLCNVKQEKTRKKQNVQISNNPSSKAERLFRPVKSVLTVFDPEMKCNFRCHSPKNSSSHESIKHQTDFDKLKNLSNTLIEKAKPLAAGQSNKIKKLKQCFNSPCEAILHRSRSQALVTEKPSHTNRDIYNRVPELPPGEKKFDSGFKWFPTGKLGFKNSDKKKCVTVFKREIKNSVFGDAYKSKTGMRDSDSTHVFDRSIPFLGFPKEATHFVYSSFTTDDPKKNPQDGERNDGQKKNKKEGKGRTPAEPESSQSDVQISSSSSDTSELVYYVPFLVHPVGKDDEDEQKKKAPMTVMTQTSQTDLPVPSKPVGEVKDFSTQTADMVPPTNQKHEHTQTEDYISEAPSPPEPRKVEESEEETEETFAPDPEQRASYQTEYYDIKSDDAKSYSVSGTLDKPASNTSLPEEQEKPPEEDQQRPAEEEVITQEPASKTPSPQELRQATHSQQTSLQEEVCIALSDLTELKDIIHEYFKKTQPCSEMQKPHVDHETMTDNALAQTPREKKLPRTSRAKSLGENRPEDQPNCSETKTKNSLGNKPENRTKSPVAPWAEAKPKAAAVARPENKPECPSVSSIDYHCIHIDDLERAAVFCLCSVCGKEIKRFTINIAKNEENNAPLCELRELTNGVDIYSETIEMKAMRTKVTSSDPAQEDLASAFSSQKSSKKPIRESMRLSSYEEWNSAPSTSMPVKQSNKGKAYPKPHQKTESPMPQQSDYKHPTGQSAKEPQKFPPNTYKYARDSKDRPRTRSTEFYYPVIIKPLLSRHFTRMLEKKFNETASDDSDCPSTKQKRAYDKYFEPTDVPAGKKIKQGYEEPPRECCKGKSDFSDFPNEKYDGRMKKGGGFFCPPANEHFCEKHFLKQYKDKRSRNPPRMKSLSLGSLNNLLSSKSCHLKPVPIGYEPSFRDVFEFESCGSVKFLKTSEGNVLYHPWPSGILAYEADGGSGSSFDDKKFPTTPSPENSHNEEEICEECKQCTCCFSDSDNFPDVPPMTEITEEPEDWESHSRTPEPRPQRRKSRSFSGYPCGNTNSQPSGTFWFGKDQKKN